MPIELTLQQKENIDIYGCPVELLTFLEIIEETEPDGCKTA